MRPGAFSIFLPFLFVACAGGLQKLDFAQDGRERKVLLHVPALARDANRRPPLILVLHGGGGTARGMVRQTRGSFNRMADKVGYLVAYPEGVDRSWNDGRRDPISTAHREQIDDAGFLKNVIARLVRDYNADPNRVFATGLSNGGFMSLRLACDSSGVLRGAVAVTAQLTEVLARDCRPPRPLALMLINGADDELVPFAGGEVRVFGKGRGRILSTAATLERFRTINRCGPAGATAALPDGDPDDGTRLYRTDWSCPAPGRLSLIRVEGGGHAWPGGRQYLPVRLVGRASRDADAAVLISDFFLGL